MNTRRTADYSPTLKGSKEENQAINARREMIATFASAPVAAVSRRKSWAERMAMKAKGFEVRH